MLVQCPGCQTTYRVAEDAVATPKPTFRCSRCKNVFVLGTKGAGKSRERSEASAPDSLQSQELSFTFPANTGSDNDERQEEKIAELSAQAPAANGPAPEEQEAPLAEKRDEEWSLFSERPSRKDFALRGENAQPQFAAPAESPFVFAREDQTAGGQTLQRATPSSRPLSVTPFLLLCVIIIFLSASVTLLHQARPAAVEQMLKGFPVIGPSIARNDYLRQGIVLQTTLTRLQRIQGNRDVFILSGAAVNRNRVKVREVKIEGFVFGRDGNVIERQQITIGNAISPKIIHDLTKQEIEDLQKQGPVKRFEIQPDETAPFSIVFFKTGDAAQSFGYRVLSADEA
jgi:predicted Zn finger-like uncharacterized protein